MSLDLSRTATQIDEMTVDLKTRQSGRELRIQSALRALAELRLDDFESKLAEGGDSTWAVPRILAPPGSRHASPETPPDFSVVSADGSHIGVDRHMPVRCFLINSGVSVLTYGSAPGADLYNAPRLFARDDEVVMRDDVSYREQAIEGAVLGAKRAVEEIRALLAAVNDLPSDVPTLGLLDGTLVMLGLVGQGFPEFVIQELIEDGFVSALEELRSMAKDRHLAVASYISLPGHFEVVNALRLMACRYSDSEAELRCGVRGPGKQPCDRCVGGVLDHEVFARLLGPGERSAVFATSSRVVEEHYRGNGVCFFYVNVGEEIGRVEVPSWVADDEGALGLVHSLVVAQCRRGRGYPVGLMEAHEQAVVSGADRRYFVQLVEKALHNEGMPVYTSEKARSKVLRWL